MPEGDQDSNHHHFIPWLQ